MNKESTVLPMMMPMMAVAMSYLMTRPFRLSTNITRHTVGKIRGAFDANTGAIHLFDAADQSSFIHESAHMYLTEMERMVQEEEAPKQLIEDWHTIQDWASYADGRLDDYKEHG